jgi:uncharacterized membrane protein YuzA (DUF378 family)
VLTREDIAMKAVDTPLPAPAARIRIRRLTMLERAALALLIIGGLNWALVGLFEFNLVSALFGPMSPLSRVVYVAVGVAAIYAIYLITRLKTRL